MEKSHFSRLSEFISLDSSDYNTMLLNLIPFLKYFKFGMGGEGKAYFIEDLYIVKEYVKLNNPQFFETFFEEYCKEMQEFANAGYNVPKIYAWQKIPSVVRTKDGSGGIKYKYYILQEQVHGRQMFSEDISDIFYMCEKFCSEKQFDSVLKNPNVDVKLFAEIVRTYIRDFIEVNTQILDMSEVEIENFILTVYNTYRIGRFSSPDMYPTNVINNDGKFTMIDSNITDRANDEFLKLKTPETFTLQGLIALFLYNARVKEFRYSSPFMFDANFADIRQSINRNIRLCNNAIKRMLNVANKCMNNPGLTDKTVLKNIYAQLRDMLDKDKANKIVNLVICKNFGM